MNQYDAATYCKRVTYKRGWKLETYASERGLDLRLTFMAPCAVTGRGEILVTMTNFVDAYYLETLQEHHFQRYLFDIFRKAEMHELAEFFKLDGVAIYDPHKGET